MCGSSDHIAGGRISLAQCRSDGLDGLDLGRGHYPRHFDCGVLGAGDSQGAPREEDGQAESEAAHYGITALVSAKYPLSFRYFSTRKSNRLGTLPVSPTADDITAFKNETMLALGCAGSSPACLGMSTL